MVQLATGALRLPLGGMVCVVKHVSCVATFGYMPVPMQSMCGKSVGTVSGQKEANFLKHLHPS